jgi:hypothetical protein
VSEPTVAPPARSRPFLSLSIRELLLLVVVAALATMYFLPRVEKPQTNSKALYQIQEPIEYRYWHQRGNTGTGTGPIGSGSEWLPADGIEVFDHFVILHRKGGIDRMVEQAGLRWFDWRRVEPAK